MFIPWAEEELLNPANLQLRLAIWRREGDLGSISQACSDYRLVHRMYLHLAYWYLLERLLRDLTKTVDWIGPDIMSYFQIVHEAELLILSRCCQ